MLSVEALADIKEEGSTTDAFTSTVLNGNNRDHRLSNASGSYRDDCYQYVFVFEFASVSVFVFVLVVLLVVVFVWYWSLH